MAFQVLAGSWPDVIPTLAGYALVRVVTTPAGIGTVICEENGVEIWSRTVVTGLRPKWTRVAADPVTGEVRALLTCAIANNRDRAIVVSEAAEVDLGLNTFAQMPVAMEYAGGDFVVYLATSKFTYTRYPLAGVPVTGLANPFPVTGTVMGIRDVVAGTLSWDGDPVNGGYAVTTIGLTDFYHARTRGTVTVGNQKGPPDTPEGVIASPDGVGVSSVITLKSYYPTLANVTVGPMAGKTLIVVRSATAQTATGTGNIALFVGPPWPDYTTAQGTGLLGLSGLYQQPMVQRDTLHVTVPWYLWFTKLVEQAYGPIDLGSAQVQGMLPPENGGAVPGGGGVIDVDDISWQVIASKGYWSPLSDGDLVEAELIFADGETIAVFTPTP